MKSKKIIALAVLITVMVCAVLIACVACEKQHEHKLALVEKVDATCTQAGNEAYYKCTDPECGKLFSDEAATNALDAVPTIPAKGHQMTKHSGTPATCTTDGTADYYTCANEADTVYYVDEQGSATITNLEVKALGHDMTKHDSTPATCTEKGVRAYWTCSHESDDIHYANAEGTSTLDTLEIPAKGHQMTEHPAVAPTCNTPGTKKYYTCANESSTVYYADEEGETKLEDITVAATGVHDPKPVFSNTECPAISASGGTLTANKVVCANCGEEIPNASKDITYDKGIEGSTAVRSRTVITSGKTYITLKQDSIADGYYRLFIGFEVTKAGTYTLNIYDVFKAADAKLVVAGLNISTGYATATFGTYKYEDFETDKGTWVDETRRNNVDGIDSENPCQTPDKLVFTFSETDIGDSGLKVSIQFRVYGELELNCGSATQYSVLFDLQTPLNESSATAPQEIAILNKRYI